MTTQPKTSDVLFKAADIIEETGWCRGMNVDEKGRHCIQGGILDALVEVRGITRIKLKNDALAALSDELGSDVLYWNDYGAKKKRYVLRLMRRVARKLAQ